MLLLRCHPLIEASDGNLTAMNKTNYEVDQNCGVRFGALQRQTDKVAVYSAVPDLGVSLRLLMAAGSSAAVGELRRQIYLLFSLFVKIYKGKMCIKSKKSDRFINVLCQVFRACFPIICHTVTAV